MKVKLKRVLISIKPKYWEKILSGEKVWEFRKCRIDGNVFYVYATAPVSKVVGRFCIAGCLQARPESIYEAIIEHGCVTKEEFMDYYKGKRNAYAHAICNVKKFAEPKPLSAFGLKRPPQSFCYTEVKL